MNEIILVLKYKLLWLMALLAAAFTAGSFFHPGFVPFALMPGLGLFDQIGYGFVVQRLDPKTGKSFEPEKITESAYHITGFLMNLATIGLVFILESHLYNSAVAWYCIIGFVLPYWFGAKDVLYYFGLQEKMSDEMYWFYWTPLGIFRSIKVSFRKGRAFNPLTYLKYIFFTHQTKVYLSRDEVTYQCLLGLGMTAAYLFFYFPKGI